MNGSPVDIARSRGDDNRMSHPAFRIVGLPGDGIGPEVYASACAVLAVLQETHGLHIELEEQLIGGAAVDATGMPLPPGMKFPF